MAKAEKLLYTCRSATRFRPRVCYGAILGDGVTVAVRSWRSSGGVVRQTLLPAGDANGKHSSVNLAAASERGAATAGCLAIRESLTLWLHAPLTSRAKAEKVLPALLDIQLPFPVEDCIYRFVEFRRTAEGTVSALVCAARREAIRVCLDRYRLLGFDPMFLDHEGLALWTQGLAESAAEERRHRVLVCLADDHVALVIGQGQRYGNAYSLRLPPVPSRDEAWINRLQLHLRAELPPGADVQWLFCGARAGEQEAVESLHRSLALVWPGPLTLLAEPSSFLARALCARAMKRGPLRCDLRQESFAHPAILRAEKKRTHRAAVVILAAGLLLLAFSLTARFVAGRRFNLVKSLITSTAGELAPGRMIHYGREIAEVETAWDQQALATAPFLDAFVPSLAPRLAAVAGAGQASNVRFETLSLGRSSLVLTGVAADWDQCGQLEERLTAMGYTVKLERQENIAENGVRFTINATGSP